MAISRLQFAQNRALASTSSTVTLSSSTPGSLIVVFTAISTFVNITAVTDNQGNTYTLAPSTSCTSGASNNDMWYAYNTTGGVTGVTVAVDSSGTVLVDVVEYSGVSTISPLEDSNNAQSVSGAIVGPMLTTAGSGNLAVAALDPATVVVTGVQAPWSFIFQDVSGAGIVDYIIPSPSTVQAVGIPSTAQQYGSPGGIFLQQTATTNQGAMFLVF